ncbi:MAG: DUF364 domain-containing protein [Alphaproteobacteria bacterium]|nr:DUF364 domain-containing protein [Alphaproteobacteria bacterium]
MTTAADTPFPVGEDVLFSALSDSIAGDAGRVIVGLNWTLVEGPHGVGLAHTPARGTAGCHALPSPGDYGGRALTALAAMWSSENVFERAIALAAINADCNRDDLAGISINGFDLIEDRGERTVIIGRFPGLENRLPKAAVIEREPGPGDYPEDAGPHLLAKAEYIAITGSTLGNGSLPALLPFVQNGFTVLIGPSTPLSPALFAFGIDAVSGFVATDRDGLSRVVSEGGAVAALRKYGRYVTLKRDDIRP